MIWKNYIRKTRRLIELLQVRREKIEEETLKNKNDAIIKMKQTRKERKESKRQLKAEKYKKKQEQKKIIKYEIPEEHRKISKPIEPSEENNYNKFSIKLLKAMLDENRLLVVQGVEKKLDEDLVKAVRNKRKHDKSKLRQEKIEDGIIGKKLAKFYAEKEKIISRRSIGDIKERPGYFMTNSPNFSKVVDKLIDIEREKHVKEDGRLASSWYENKLKQKVYNIYHKSNIGPRLMGIYEKNSNIFKFNIHFGLILEDRVPSTDKDFPPDFTYRIFAPSNNYAIFHEPRVVRNELDMKIAINNLFNIFDFDKDNPQMFEDSSSSTRLIGVYSMGVKIYEMDTLIGVTSYLPDSIIKSKSIIALAEVENNVFLGMFSITLRRKR